MAVSKRNRYAVALFGAGRIGSVHARNVDRHPDSRLAAVVDVDSSAAKALAEFHGAAVRSQDDVLGDAAIDAVVVASSTNTHADLIEAGVTAGKAVFCEKPVDLDLPRATACLQEIGGQSHRVMMGFNRRFDPNFRHLKRAFDRGEIGKGELLTLTSFDPEPPTLDYVAVSGGLFRDMAIHDFDLACWLLGGIPARVTATGACLVDARVGAFGDVDTAVTVLHFPDGGLATIRNSRRAVYGYDQRIELLGEEGLLCAGNEMESTLVKATSEGFLGPRAERFFLERYRLAYEAEWDHFLKTMPSGMPSVTIRDGVAALAIAEAANTSLTAGRTVDITYPKEVQSP